MLLLVTGATGYIGGRLVPELLDAGHRVRVLARHPERLVDRAWAGRVEIATGDATDAAALHAAMVGVDVGYYLMHSMLSGDDFEREERRVARLFGQAARDCELSRIVYLGALAHEGRGRTLSHHIRSRQEVGETLRASGVPTIELRAAMIIGSGSASFEMVRHLTERLPVMITPRWVRTRTQPIAIRDVLRYLVAVASLPDQINRAFEVGGPEILTYRGMIEGYARVAGLRDRRIVPVPVLTPSLSSHWVGAVTPVPRAIARPLVDSLSTETVCREHDIAELVPDPPEGLVPYERAVELALRRVEMVDVATTWSDSSVPGVSSDPLPSDPDWAGGTIYIDERRTTVAASAASLWQVIDGVGGGRGYYSFPLAWEVRGWLDRLGGGVGLARGRRDPDRLRVGDPLDFWRVEARVPMELLRLRAEMRLPGLAWLELSIERQPDPDGHESVVYHQRALFHPRGLWGHVYWRAVAPFHGRIFGPMLTNIRAAAEELERSVGAGPGAGPSDATRTMAG
ncbi:MAG TPA: SDR family oxidoreductase [Candidatus Nanopelagicales bacterium]|nr:SDR family oxidoreductase [Candidatus Nanopelagicales bacterium]